MAKVCFFEFWNITPHLETSFELAKQHFDKGDTCHYFFCGHDSAYREGILLSPQQWKIRLGLARLPECRAAALIESERFNFHPRVDLSPVQWESPNSTWTIESLKAFKYQEYEAGLSALSSLAFRLGSGDPDLEASAGQIQTMLDSGIRVYQFAIKQLKDLKPDLVYLFNGRFSNCRAVMNAAQVCDIPYLIHERGATINRYYLQPYMPHDTKKIQSQLIANWTDPENKDEKRRVAEMFFKERRAGKDQGWHSFTTRQSAGKLPNMDGHKRIVSYFSSSDDEYLAVGDIYKWCFWNDQFDAVLSLIEICGRLTDIQLIIRLHPNLASKAKEDRDRWVSLCEHQHVIVLEPESEIDTYALIEASDIVVTAGSTVGIEAVYWNTPCINLGPSDYSELNASYHPEGAQELEELLQSDRLKVRSEDALPYGYHAASFGRPFQFYQPESLHRGRFLGTDLQRLPLIPRIAENIKAFFSPNRSQ